MQETQVLGLLAATLYLLITIFPFLLLLMILFKKNKGSHDKILIAWFGVHAFNSFLEILKVAGLLNDLPFFIDLNRALFMLNLFFFQAFGRSILDHEFKLKKRVVLALAPFAVWVLIYCVLMVYKIAQPSTTNSAVFLEFPLPFQLLEAIVITGIVLLCIGMLLEIKNVNRDDSKTYLTGPVHNFRKLLITILTVFLLLAIWEYGIPETIKSEGFKLLWGTILLLLVVMSIALFSFFCIRQKSVFKKQVVPKQSHESIIQVTRKIKQIMDTDKPYLDPDFSVSKLAVMSGEPPQKISEAIKVKHNGNFLSYVNQYRVEEAKNMIQDPGFKNYSLVAIGLEAGFNSKATFNRVFKNETGMTPSAYGQKIKMTPIDEHQ